MSELSSPGGRSGEDAAHTARNGTVFGGEHGIPYSVLDGEGAVRMATGNDIALDIETAGLGRDAYDIHSVQIATARRAHVLHPVINSRAICDAIASARTLYVHNSPFDVPILVALDYMRIADIPKVFDTLIAARMAAPSDRGGHDLARAVEAHCPYLKIGDKRSLAERFRAATGGSKAQMFRELDIRSEAFCAYAARDAVMTAHLAAALPHAMQRHTTEHPFSISGDWRYLLTREQIINHMLLARTCRGIEVDVDVIEDLTVELQRQANGADLVLDELGVDTSLSPPLVKQAVMLALDREEMIPANYPRLQTGAPSADRRFLEQLGGPIPEALRARSQALRFIADYGDKILHLAREGRIHPQVSIAAAVTGRMSMKDPPLQQYPGAVRQMMKFDTPATSMDWSSIEPVVIGNLAGQTGWIEGFEAGGDLYEPVAEAAGVPRKVAKVVLLAQLYGQGISSLGWALGLDPDQTKVVIDRVMGPLDMVRTAIRAIRNVGDKYGMVQTISGRICPLDRDYRTGNKTFLGYKGVNYTVQGSAYDLLAEAIVEMHRRGLDDALYVAVHDELVVATEVAHEVEQIMRTPPDALIQHSGRTPVLRVGRTDLGHYWQAKD